MAKATAVALVLVCALAGAATGRELRSSKQPSTLYEVLLMTPSLSYLLNAVDYYGLSQKLDEKDLVATMFAPTNDAIKWTADAMNMNVSDFVTDWDIVSKIIPYQVVPSQVNLVGAFATGQGSSIATTLSTMLPGQYLMWLQNKDSNTGSITRTVQGTESGKATITPDTPVATTKAGAQLVPIDDVMFPMVTDN